MNGGKMERNKQERRVGMYNVKSEQKKRLEIKKKE